MHHLILYVYFGPEKPVALTRRPGTVARIILQQHYLYSLCLPGLLHYLLAGLGFSYGFDRGEVIHN